jgi:hypothetical protein
LEEAVDWSLKVLWLVWERSLIITKELIWFNRNLTVHLKIKKRIYGLTLAKHLKLRETTR